MSDWISTTQAAIRIGCCRETVIKLILEGHIRARKIRSQWRVSSASVDQYLKRAENGVLA